jgi:excisionase family DNA binding protein
MTEFLMITRDDLKKVAAEVYQLCKNDAEENTKEDILNVKGAAKLLDLSPATIYGKTHRNEIPYFKQGKKLLFSRAALVTWLKKGENPVAIIEPSTAKSKAAEYLHKNRRF